MALIKVNHEVLAGNIGDDEEALETAYRFAEYLKSAWEGDLEQLSIDDFEIEVNVDVIDCTSGPTEYPHVSCQGVGDESADSWVDYANELLTDEQTVWDRFCKE